MISLIKEKEVISRTIVSYKADNKRIGYVPTMGSLHNGHLSLIKKCISENDISVVSIFVNPIQFNENDDYQNYPRSLEQDIKKIENLGCDIVFAPKVEEIYPRNMFDRLEIDLGNLDNILEAKYREGHFSGVVTVLKKFFDLIRPDQVYFGQKDFQQFLVVQKIVKEFNYKLKLSLCPIVREPDGLAMSSRNLLLNVEERKIAPVLFETLTSARVLLLDKPFPNVVKWAKDKLSSIEKIKFEYFEILNAEDLTTAISLEEQDKIIICAAIKIGDIRLIDNLIVK